MRLFYFLTFFFLISCTTTKSVLICGDHECINKTEAKQYFNDNLTIELKITSKSKETRFDLVSLNLDNNDDNKIQVFKNKNRKIIRKLSKKEIIEKKQEIKKQKKIAKLNKKRIIKEEKKKKVFDTSNVEKPQSLKPNDKETNKSKPNANKDFDICLMVKKCDIDSITKYLIKLSNAKDYPNINLRN